jgi:hypothetical protein
MIEPHALHIPAGGRGTKALRLTTRVLREVADRLEGTALLAMFAVGIAGISHVGPAWLQASGNELVVFVFAAWGLAKLGDRALYDIADWIDPDARDGDSAFVAAELFKQLAADVRQGAEWDDVRIGLKASQVLPALYGALDDLGDVYAGLGEDDEAEDLRAAAAGIRTASRHLGDKSA